MVADRVRMVATFSCGSLARPDPLGLSFAFVVDEDPPGSFVVFDFNCHAVLLKGALFLPISPLVADEAEEILSPLSCQLLRAVRPPGSVRASASFSFSVAASTPRQQ